MLKNIFLRCFEPFGGKGLHLGDVTKPVSGPSAGRNFILEMLQNLCFYVVLGSRRRPGAEKLAS